MMKKKADLDKIEQIFAKLHVGECYDFSTEQACGIAAVSHLLEHFFGVSVLTFRISEVDEAERYFIGMADHFRYLGSDYQETPVKVLFCTEEPETIWIELLFSSRGERETKAFAWMKNTLSLQVKQVRCFVICQEEALGGQEYFFQSFQCTSGSGLELPWLSGENFLENRWQLGLDYYHREEGEKFKFQGLQGIGNAWEQLEGLIPETVRSAFEQVELTGFLAEGDLTNGSGCEVQEMQIMAGGESGAVWAITEDLMIEEISLKASRRCAAGWKRKQEELTISGTAGLWGTKIPVTSRWDVEGTYYSLCVGNGTDRIEIADLDELTFLVKQSFKVEDFLPLDYSFGKMYVKKVFLEMDRGSGKIREFSFCIGLEEHWKIFKIFEIKELELYVSCSGEDFFVLTGELGISGADLALESRKEEEFRIEGYTLNTDEISLQDLLESFSIDAGDLPQIDLEELRFACRPQKGSYSFSAAVKWNASSEDLWQFESVSEEFSLDAEKDADGEWKMDVEISGQVCFHSFEFLLDIQLGEQARLSLTFQDDPEKFRLQEFLGELGFENLDIPECLDLALSGLELEYIFSEKKLWFLTALKQGKLYFQTDMNGKIPEKRRYILLFMIDGAIDLAELPLAGTILSGEETVSISDFMLTAASEKVEDLYVEGMQAPECVERGMAFSMSLCLPEEVKKLCIPLGSSEQNTSDKDAVEGFAQTQVGRRLGPFYFEGLVVSFQGGRFRFSITAELNTSGLSFGLEGLSAEYCLSDGSVSFGLQGLEVSLNTGVVRAGGGFVNKGNDEYAGTLLMEAAGLSLSAVGAYHDGTVPSMFAFAFLGGLKFGPPCFSLTGISAGMGYSRRILIPPVENLETFPLMQVVLGKENLAGLLSKVDELFPEKEKDSWIAAGIEGTSFHMADADMIAAVQLGSACNFNLLGRIQVEIPYRAPEPLAKACLLLRISVDPKQGYIPIDGFLGSDSYVLSKNCHLSGGFSCYLWYAGEHRGDFVISLGGYHSRFQRPAHYPSPQRIQMSWQLCPELYAGGSLYFALTPSAVMAGGDFQMDFSWKCVKAWFHAYVDILMCWKPYTYDFAVGISLGINVNLHLFKLHFELGCSLRIWGPDFSGEACIHLWIISFTISFGHGARKPQTISIAEFRESFLALPDGKEVPAADDAGDFAGVSFELTTNPGSMQIRVISPVPLANICFNQKMILEEAADGIWIRPCAVEASPILMICLERVDQSPVRTVWELDRIRENVPSALWAPTSWKEETVEYDTGLQIQAQPPQSYRGLCFTAQCREEEEPCVLPQTPECPDIKYDQTQAYDMLDTVDEPEISERRNALFEGLEMPEIDLSGFQDPREIFRAAPVLARTGGKENG